MGKDKQKKAERAESGKDAEIVRLKAELGEAHTLRQELNTAQDRLEKALQNELDAVRAELAAAKNVIAKQDELIKHLKVELTEMTAMRDRARQTLEDESCRLVNALEENGKLKTRVTELEAAKFPFDAANIASPLMGTALETPPTEKGESIAEAWANQTEQAIDRIAEIADPTINTLKEPV